MKRTESGNAAVADQPMSKNKKAVSDKPVPVAEKKCSKCEDVFPIDDFSRCKTNPDGHKYVCKKCDRELQVDYRKKKRDEKACKVSPSGTDKNDSTPEIQEPTSLEQQERVCKSWIGDEEDSLMKAEDVDIRETILPVETMDPAKLARAMSETKAFVMGGKSEEAIASISEMPHGQIIRLQPGIERLPESKTLTIDFKNHPDIYESIQEIAYDEFRAPEMQVLFWLKCHLASSGDSRYRGKMYQQG